MPSGRPVIILNVQNIIDFIKGKIPTDPSVLQFLRGNLLLNGKKVNSLIFILQYADKQQDQDLSRCVIDLLLNNFDVLNESDWRLLSDEQIPAIIYFLSLLLFQKGLQNTQQHKIYNKLPEYGMDICSSGFTILNKFLSLGDPSKFQPGYNLFCHIFKQYLNNASAKIMFQDAINHPKFYPELYKLPLGRAWTNACFKKIIGACRLNRDVDIAPLINTFLEMACLAAKEKDIGFFNYLFEFLSKDARNYFFNQDDERFYALPIWKLIHLKSFAPADFIEPVDSLLYFCIENSNLNQFLALDCDNGVSKNGVQLLLEMTDRDPELVETFLLRFMGELNITHIAHTIEDYEYEDLNKLLEQLNTSLITQMRLITHPDLYLWVQQLLVQMEAIEYPIYVDNYYENEVLPDGYRQDEPVQSINPYQLHTGFLESQQTYSWGRSITEPVDDSPFNLAFDFNAGIHDKYLGGHLPSIPRPVAASSRPGPPPHQRIPFIRLSDVIQPNVNRTPYSIDYNGLTADFYSYDGNGITSDDNVIFVCAGRKENALLPPVTQGGRIIAVLTENELGNLEGLPNGYDILVIKGLQSSYYGNYSNLEVITSRRIGIFLFAAFCNLPIIMMLDDNIKEVTFEEGSLSIFHYLARQFKNEVCLTVPTKSYSASEASKKELGSKFFMIRLDRVRARLTNDQLLYLLFPEAKCANYWGEDYYLQIMFDALFPGQEVLATLPQENIALIRSRQHINAFLKTGKKAELLPELPIDAFYQFPPVMHRLLTHAISAFNRIVIENEQRYQNKLSYIESMDLGFKHLQANGLNHFFPGLRDAVNDDQMEVSAPEILDSYTIAIRDKPFRERFESFTQSTQFKNESLRGYQQEAIRQVCNMQEQKGSLIMATGSGKTRTQCDLARLAYHAAIDGEAIFIVTPYIKLVNQFFNGFVAHNKTSSAANVDLRVPLMRILTISSDGKSCNLSLITKNSKWKEGKSILIFCQASFDKLLAEHPDLMEHCVLLLLDEYHEYSKTIKALNKHTEAYGYSPFVVGSTATPHRQIDLKPVYTYSRAQGIIDGFLASVISDTLGLDFSDSNLDGVINALPNFLANLVHPGFCNRQTLAQTRGIIFLPSIRHCEQLEKVLNEHGIRCHSIHSKNSKNKEELEKYLGHREPTVLLAVQMLGVGFDDPSLSWIILAIQNVNLMQVEQMVGRVMRRDGEKIGYILGFNAIIQSVKGLLKSHPQDIVPLNDHYYGQSITCGSVTFTTGKNPEENEESKKRPRVETADVPIELTETDSKRAKKGLGFFAPQPSVIKENINSQTNYRIN